VESVWHASGQIPYPRERIAPTGSAVAGIVLGPALRQTPAGGEPFTADRGFLIGPHDRPIVNEPTGRTECVGIVATPIGCRAVFGIAPAPLRGRVVDLLAAWPTAGSLRARLPVDGDPDELLDRVESELRSGLDESDHGLARCASAVAALQADPTRPVADIAAELGLSHGHLDREFARIVGMGPRTLARVLRVRRLLELVDVHGPVAWTRLAADLGWYDQSHLVRDVVRHTGEPPSAYVSAQLGVAPVAEPTPGFVPLPGR
jgi:AraC-like DNA-binding protein